MTAQGRMITPKFGNKKEEPLDTANFNQLLDDIVSYAHGEERKTEARLTAKFEAQEQASREAIRKQTEQSEKAYAEAAQGHDKEQRKDKLSQLHAHQTGDTSVEGVSFCT